MRTLKLTIAYDGSGYAGWQVQRASAGPTIQGTIQAALQQILQRRVHVVGSGRTDAGVHALGQVAHIRTTTRLSCATLQRALNAVLPEETVVTGVEEAAPTFHARFSAASKRYRYRIVTGAIVLPCDRRYVHHVRVPLNVALMRREAAVLIGRHDLRAFHRAGRVITDTRRTILAVVVRRAGCELVVEIEANGFLQGMARSIVGTLIEIARGHRPPGTMAKILRSRDRQLVGPTAPAKGLCLLRVCYSRSSFRV